MITLLERNKALASTGFSNKKVKEYVAHVVGTTLVSWWAD